MDKELEDKLFEKYPKIFPDGRKVDPKRSLICFGLDCGNGWYTLIDKLCEQLQFDIDKNDYPQVEAVQVKEKFGGLRFYINSGNRKQFAMIHLAESLSFSICERCGKFSSEVENKPINGWYKSLCPKCRKEFKEREKEK